MLTKAQLLAVMADLPDDSPVALDVGIDTLFDVCAFADDGGLRIALPDDDEEAKVLAGVIRTGLDMPPVPEPLSSRPLTEGQLNALKNSPSQVLFASGQASASDDVADQLVELGLWERVETFEWRGRTRWRYRLTSDGLARRLEA